MGGYGFEAALRGARLLMCHGNAIVGHNKRWFCTKENILKVFGLYVVIHRLFKISREP